MSKVKKGEEIVHIFFWIIIYIVSIASMMPIISLEASDSSYLIVLSKVAVKAGLGILPFLVLFFVHNHFIAPVLIRKNNIALYVSLLVILLTAFILFEYKVAGSGMPGHRNPGVEMQRHMPHELEARPEDDGFDPPDGKDSSHSFRQGDHFGPDGRMMGKVPGAFPMSPEFLKISVAILMLFSNLGLKYYYSMLDDRQKLLSLEKENLDQQLAYLRYQINPHFFMNTLNNIHALVDIDPEKAKGSIVELSKLMRYILYEGSQPTIPLEKEIEFLDQYVSLMRMRFSEKVKISLDLPESSSGMAIPPLLFISFVENAFKHGVSYEKESFIDVSMAVEGPHIIFHCSNSRNDTRREEKSGIGMENVRKRLQLLYGSEYTLSVDEKDDIFDILLIIPVNIEPVKGNA